jgi:squalene synthase HpnC
LPRIAAAPLPPTTGKTAQGENFPVASLLLPAAIRAQVMAFYRFARAADDIADDPALTPEDKLARLDAYDRALAGAGKAAEAMVLRDAVAGDSLLLGHAAQLLDAFRRDAVTDCCRDWADLMTYCQFSAAPVGRFLLDLHGEKAEAVPASDALCAALQVLNHLQDCGTDYRALGRVYLPRNWLLMAGIGPESLAAPRSEPGLRAVLDQVLDQVDGLIDLARLLPGLIADWRLRLQAGITVAAAERLSHHLRRRDPLAEPVKLSPLDNAGVIVAGILLGLGLRA